MKRIAGHSVAQRKRDMATKKKKAKNVEETSETKVSKKAPKKKKKAASGESEVKSAKPKKKGGGEEKKPVRKAQARLFPELSSKGVKIYEKINTLTEEYEATKSKLLEQLNDEVGEQRTFRLPDGVTATIVQRHGGLFLRAHVATRKSRKEA